MPHIVVEYADDDVIPELIGGLLDAIVELADRSASIELPNLKLRALPFRHFRVSGKRLPFIHVSIALMRGRKQADLHDLINDIYNLVSAMIEHVQQVTVEVREFEPENYKKRH